MTMARPVHVFFLFVEIALSAAFGSELLYAQSPSAQGAANDARRVRADVQKLCANVPPGETIMACLKHIRTRFRTAASRP